MRLGPFGLLMLGLATQPSGCADDVPRPSSPPWLEGETIAGLDLARDVTAEAIGRLLDPYVRQHVTVVVVHSDAAHYLPDDQVEAQVALMQRTADEAHVRGLKVMWAVPSLRVISPDGMDTKLSMGNAHPEWLAIAAEATEEDGADEVAYLCPEGGYRTQLFERTARWASTGIDGLVMEAPKMPPPRGGTPFFCPDYRALFKRDTGFEAPSRVDCLGEDALTGACFTLWNDPGFRAFVGHRHRELASLQANLVDSVKGQNGGAFQIWFRDAELDTNAATETGNDASFVRPSPSMARLWDVPSPSEQEGMRRASPTDWTHRLLLAKLARGLDRRAGQRTFMTSAGDREWDAQLLLGIGFAEQASPWELHAPSDSVSVGDELRTRTFGWARSHERALYGGAPFAKVAVLHVPVARDYVDFGAGLGLYSRTAAPTTFVGGGGGKPDPTWWTTRLSAGALDAGVDELEVVGEQRGIGRLLVRMHVPFVIENVERVSAADLAAYSVVFAPSARALSDAQLGILRGYIEAGGTLVSTGLGLGTHDGGGTPRATAPFVLPAQDEVTETTLGKGTLVQAQALLGRRALRYDDPFATAFVGNQLARVNVESIAPTASPEIHVEPWIKDDALVVHVLSFAGIDGGPDAPKAADTTAAVTLTVPRAVTKASLSSPEPTIGDVRDVTFTTDPADAARVTVSVPVTRHTVLTLSLGGTVVPKVVTTTPSVTKLVDASGYAGHSLAITGAGLGVNVGKVRLGDGACTVTSWTTTRVTAFVPGAAAPSTKDVVVETASGVALPAGSFTVKPNPLPPTTPMLDGLAFVKTKMRSPWGGIYTNYIDHADVPGASDVYPYGHHQTAEHVGLMLWVSAGMLDHDAFEGTYGFLVSHMFSPRRDLVNWAVDKKTGAPMLQKDEGSALPLDGNAPLDDFRVVRGLYSGYLQWKDERYLNAAIRAGDALLRTSIGRSEPLLVEYPDGLVGYAYNWPENAGLGKTDDEVVPIDYADLWTMKWLSERDARWKPVIASSVSLMERAALPNGQFWNSYLPETKALSGDFEFRNTVAGTKIKTIQSLWIALHLARVGRTEKAKKALEFYKDQYATKGRVAEYLNTDGTDVPSTQIPDALPNGEARIYAQLVRLAIYLGDKAFADKVVTEKLLTDQVTTAGSSLYGSFGKDSAIDGDAEAWNTLETLLALLLQQGSPVLTQTYPAP